MDLNPGYMPDHKGVVLDRSILITPSKSVPTEPAMPPATRPGSSPWRLAEWHALPEVCFIHSCEGGDIDQRGPVFLRDGSMHKACVEHWEPIMRVLGEQATWQRTDAARSPGAEEG